MKSLEVPLHLQPEQSEDCGPTSTLMVLDYYGLSSNLEEVTGRLPKTYYGTTVFDNANLLLSYGLDVEMVTAHPELFDGDFIRSHPSDSEVIDRISEVQTSEERPEGKEFLTSLLGFVAASGTLTLEVPSRSTIERAINEEKPVWASMYGGALGPNQGGYHAVVLSGYNDTSFNVLNPLPESRQKSWEKADEVIFGIHASTLLDYDNGAILIAGKKA